MDGSDVKSEVFEDELVWIDDEDPLVTRDTEVGGKEMMGDVAVTGVSLCVKAENADQVFI